MRGPEPTKPPDGKVNPPTPLTLRSGQAQMGGFKECMDFISPPYVGFRGWTNNGGFRA